MLFDVVMELKSRPEALEHDQRSLGANVEQKADRLQPVTPNRSGKGHETMISRVDALMQWTGKARATILFDSTVDEFTRDGLFDKVKGKRNIALVGFTTKGDVFGGFYSVAVTVQDKDFFDPDMFIFSFESRGRCETPKRFGVKKALKDEANVLFSKDTDNKFVYFWADNEEGGGFVVGDDKSKSFCCDLSIAFEGLEDTTLSGNNGYHTTGPFHSFERLVAIQLK